MADVRAKLINEGKAFKTAPSTEQALNECNLWISKDFSL